MSDPIQPQPPSRPDPPSAGGGARGLARASDAIASFQTIGALVIGILLFAVPLYLWRRPRSTQPTLRADAAAPDASRDAAPVSSSAPAPAPPPALHVKLADAHIIECHDPGPKRTPPDQCDHIPAFEKAFGDAIEAAHDCVPTDAGPGSIEYVADLSFARRRSPVTLALPRDGRSFQSSKIVRDCAAGVRARLSTLPVAPLVHAHGRYKISVVATYDGTSTH